MAARLRSLSRAWLRIAATSALALASGSLASCVEQPTGIDIALYPDPQLNTLDQVLAETRSVEVVLDAVGGLYFPGEESDDGTIAIMDADGDPNDLELVARVDSPSSRLPRIRLERGSLPDVPIDVSVRGYDGLHGEGTYVASGSLPVVFEGSHADVAVPFNLLAERRPPRVDAVLAGPTPSCAVPVLSVVFSRPVDAASALGPGVFTFEPGGAPTAVRIDSVNGLGTIALVTPPPAVVASPRIRFRLTVATSIVDASGVHLDQVLPIAGDQPYLGRYDEPCTP